MSEWISTKYRMPEKNGRYLVCVPYYDCVWIGVSTLDGKRFYDETATHWMDLPKAPILDEDDGA